jgi:hypothetical protein
VWNVGTHAVPFHSLCPWFTEVRGLGAGARLVICLSPLRAVIMHPTVHVVKG